MSDQVQTRIDENQPPTTEGLESVVDQLTFDQMRYVVARQEHSSDQGAAESIGISPSAVKAWKYRGAPIDAAVRLMGLDGFVMACKMRRRNLAKAMAVKIKGLDSDEERVRQSVATEIVEWEMGKAMQPTDNKQSGELRVVFTGGFTDSTPDST